MNIFKGWFTVGNKKYVVVEEQDRGRLTLYSPERPWKALYEGNSNMTREEKEAVKLLMQMEKGDNS